jgi:hypothetical protein
MFVIDRSQEKEKVFIPYLGTDTLVIYSSPKFKYNHFPLPHSAIFLILRSHLPSVIGILLSEAF